MSYKFTFLLDRLFGKKKDVGYFRKNRNFFYMFILLNIILYEYKLHLALENLKEEIAKENKKLRGFKSLII